MLKNLILLGFVLVGQISFAQNVGINSSGTAPVASAGLDVNFTDKGLLIPRVALLATNNSTSPVLNPAVSLLVYNTADAGTAPYNVVKGYYFWNGTAWSPLATGAGSQWLTSGTSIYYNTGNVGINNSSPGQALDVTGNLKFSGALMPNNNAGSPGYVLTSSGAGAAPTWQDASATLNTFWSIGGNTVAGASVIGTNSNHDFGLETNGTERLRVSASGNIGVGTITPASSALLDLTSTTQGMLAPRMTAAQRGAIATPAEGLLVYQTDVTRGFYFYTQGTWSYLSSGLSGWTASGSNLWYNSTGNVGIGANPGTGTNSEKLVVDAGTTSYNAISGKGNLNNYLQLNIKNSNAGTNASSDIVATANNGDETTNYVDLGINSSGNTSNFWGGANDAYLYNLGQDFLIGTGTAGKHLAFLTGGGTQSANERMRIESDGKVGIGTNIPTELLDVNGKALFGAVGTTGRVKISNTDDSGIADIFTPDDRMLRISNNGMGQTGSSLQLKDSNENFLFSFEGRGGFRYYSRNSLAEKFRVNDDGDIFLTTTAKNTALDAQGDINDFYELNIQNKNAGSNASTDIIATANNGTDADAYVDMGINSSGYSNSVNGVSTILNGANTAYVYGNGENFFIGNAARNKPLIFFTNSSSQDGGVDARGTERMRIIPTGSVGIGTNTPLSLLHIASPTSGNLLYLQNTSGGGGTQVGIAFKTYTGGGAPAATIAAIDNNYSSHIAFSTKTPGSDGNDLVEKVRITNIGNVLIGTTAEETNVKLKVEGNAKGYSWSNYSDRRLKENIRNLNYGLKDLTRLQPVRYNWIDPTKPGEQLGLIAQDARLVIPEIVMGDESKENLSINYTELIPVLINAIKEQQAQIDELKKQGEKNQELINLLLKAKNN